MNYQFLANTRLFRGISVDELEKMLTCFSVQTRQYEKGSLILCTGQTVSAIGLILSGNITIENNDLWGNRTVMDRLGAGAIFAESYALTPDEILMVDIVANEPTEVLFLQTRTILNPCQESCYSHRTLLGNLLAISSQKNLHMSRHILHTSPKTIRGRLLSYLSFYAQKEGNYEFDIPFDRQQLADYLGVDRSALSNELSKMQREGILRSKKNHFKLTPDCL